MACLCLRGRAEALCRQTESQTREWLKRTIAATPETVSQIDFAQNSDEFLKERQESARNLVMESRLPGKKDFSISLIGWASSFPARNEIIALYIARPMRGRAYGRALLLRMLKDMDRARPVRVCVAVDNHRAARFYAREGFLDLRPKDMPISGSRSGILVTVMERPPEISTNAPTQREE